MQLPEEFVNNTRQTMGDERFQKYMASFSEVTPVSIRLNPLKSHGLTAGGERVPWCTEGYYLTRRPQFTMDPLLHAGCYYVQEAASMFVTHILRQLLATDHPLRCLDLCAAPGGKSTAAIATLPPGSTLCSNEPIRQRASILLENITKWGYPGCTVTNNYPEAFVRSKQKYDVIICDVPCSGEGLFRRDPATISEWSPQQVERCWRLQRDIVTSAWACLQPGGIMIYSTCTFNTQENEENILWMLHELGDAEVVPVETQPEWHITGSLLEGFRQPVYRFIPGITRSEGLFVCVLRRLHSNKASAANQHIYPSPTTGAAGKKGKTNRKGKADYQETLNQLSPPGSHADSGTPHDSAARQHEADYVSAMNYLRGETLVLPADMPRGEVAITFQGHTLGAVKNIGTRANNLYPKEWRIRTTHVPTEYEPILTHIKRL